MILLQADVHEIELMLNPSPSVFAGYVALVRPQIPDTEIPDSHQGNVLLLRHSPPRQGFPHTELVRISYVEY